MCQYIRLPKKKKEKIHILGISNLKAFAKLKVLNVPSYVPSNTFFCFYVFEKTIQMWLNCLVFEFEFC